MPRSPAKPKTSTATLPATAGAKEVVVYESGAGVRLEVLSDGETVWITQEQMCKLFGRTQPVIARHVANAFREGEVDEANNMQILHSNRRKQGMSYLVQQLSAPPPDPPRKKIGF